jgi:hypothetical protein
MDTNSARGYSAFLSEAVTVCFGQRREAQRHAAFGCGPVEEKRRRRCALPSQSKFLPPMCEFS